uniref:Sororin C-terminal region domain-containing protein n=1 Tax=Cannabis sativa TaxID=3483 RepID=A0A803RC87_CANSA
MEGERRRRVRVRKPLFDCTNTKNTANTQSSRSPSFSSLRLKPQKPLFSSSTVNKLLTTNNDGNSAKNTDASQNVSLRPPQVASPPLRPPMLFSASGRGNTEVLDPCSVKGPGQTTAKRKSKIPPTEELFGDVITAGKRRNIGKENIDPNTCTLASKKIDVAQSVVQKKNTSESVYLSPPPIVSEALDPCSVNVHRPTSEERKGTITPTEELFEDALIAEKRRKKGKEIVDPNTCSPATKKIDIIQSTVQKENTSELVYLSSPPIVSKPLEPCSVNVHRQTSEKRKSTITPREELIEDALIAEKRRKKGKEILDPNTCTPATKNIDITQSTVRKENTSELVYLSSPPIVSKPLEPCSVNIHRQTSEKRKSTITPIEELFEDAVIAEKRRKKGKKIVDPNTCTPATKKIYITQSTFRKDNTSDMVYLSSPPIVSKALEPCSVNVHRQTSEKRRSTITPTEELFEDALIAEKRRNKGKGIVDPNTCNPPTKKIYITRSTIKKGKTSESFYPSPPPTVSSPSRPSSLSISGGNAVDPFKPCHIYSCRRTAQKRKCTAEASDERLSDLLRAHKCKGKAIAEPVSCPPATKIQKIGENIRETGGNSVSKANTVPTKKGQKKALSQEFIEQQRAYFAEIDAFELQEEEVEYLSE